MSLFSTILAKLGIGSAEAAPAAQGTPISTVNVVAKLEGMAATHAEKLNWKTSIVDRRSVKGLGPGQRSGGSKRAGHRVGLPGRQNGRLGAHECLAAPDGPAETGGKWRRHSERTARLRFRCR